MSRKTLVVKSQEKGSKLQRSTQASWCPRLGVEEGAVAVCKESFQEGSPGALWDKTQKEGLWQRLRSPPELVLHLSAGGPSWRLQGCTLNELGRGGMSRKTARARGVPGTQKGNNRGKTNRHFTEFLPVSQSPNPWILFPLFSFFYCLSFLWDYIQVQLSPILKIFLSHWVTPFSLSFLRN